MKSAGECVSASQALQMRGGNTKLYFAGLLDNPQLLKLNREVLDDVRFAGKFCVS